MPVPAHKRLSDHAAAIKKLGKRVAADVVEIGKRLTECKKLAGHGNWLAWLEREFGWSDETARKFMRAFDFARWHKFQQSWNMANSALHLLAKPSTPEAVRDEIVARAQAGERISRREIREARLAQGLAEGQALARIARREAERASARARVISVPTRTGEERVVCIGYVRPEPPEPTEVGRVQYETPEVIEPEPLPETVLVLREIQSLAARVRSRSMVANVTALIETLPRQQRDAAIEALNDIQHFAEAVKNALHSAGDHFEEEPPSAVRH